MNNRLFIALISSQVIFTFAPSAAIAENNSVKLEKIVVSDTRSETSNVNFPGKITVIEATQIAQSGASNLVDVLRTTGGIQISDLFGNGTDASVSLRGFSETAGQNTLILIDGRRLNNADLSTPDLNTISIKDIERIEIIKGSASVLFGDKAVGGVINIITRSPEAFRLTSELAFGSFDTTSYFASAENRYSNGLGYRINAKHQQSDLYRDNNNFELTDFYGKGSYEHNFGEIFFEYQDIDEDLRLPGPLGRAQISSNRRQTVNPDDFSDTDTEIGRLGVVQSFNDYIDGYIEYTNRRSSAQGLITVNGSSSATSIERKHVELTPRLIVTQGSRFGDRVFTVGADLFETDYRLESTFGVTDNTQKQRSIYLHGLVPVGDRLTVTTGARRTQVKNDLIAFSFPNGVEIDDDENVWQAGLAYQANNRLRLFGRVEKNFRFAVADEYASIFGALPFPQTQTGISYETGAEWRNNHSSVSVEIYQLDLNDEISFDPNLFVNTNIGDSRRRGIILESSRKLSSSWDISAVYSYLDHEITSGEFDGANIPLVADNTFALTANYQHSDRLSGYFELIATSDRVLGADFDNSASQLAGYGVSNLSLSYKMKNLKFGLRINNLFDKEYNDNGNFAVFSTPQESFFPAPERNYLFTLQYNHEAI